MPQLFGFAFDERKERLISPVPPDSDEGTSMVAAGTHFGQYIDIDGMPRDNNEFQLITKYREISLHPECDSAIDDIVNESISSDLNFAPVTIELSNLPLSPKIKTIIREEFQYILKLLNFDKKSHEIFRKWYIDGRLHYHKLIDFDKPEEGIKELRYIDALKIKKVQEVIKKPKPVNLNTGIEEKYDFGETVEYFIYFPTGFRANQNKGLRMAKETICYVPSGLMDHNHNMVISHLHKAIKPVNQLRMIEDSLVIYRLTRAPERRIMYIDVGNLPKMKAEQYLRDVMARYRNKMVYNSATGEIRDDRKHMSMLEDIWLPRRDGTKGTEISTLPGGQNLGELEDVKYFQKNLYKSLNIPLSRLEQESSFTIGRTNEITRDELKFAKFVGRLRKGFSELFLDLLKTQLVLKKVMEPNEWEELKENIQVDFIFDNHFTELKNNELLTDRLNSAGMVEPYLGRYFSAEYVRKNILHFTDGEIEEMDAQMQDEIKKGIIQDPALMMAAELPVQEAPEKPKKKEGPKKAQAGLDGDFASAFKPEKSKTNK